MEIAVLNFNNTDISHKNIQECFYDGGSGRFAESGEKVLHYTFHGATKIVLRL